MKELRATLVTLTFKYQHLPCTVTFIYVHMEAALATLGKVRGNSSVATHWNSKSQGTSNITHSCVVPVVCASVGRELVLTIRVFWGKVCTVTMGKAKQFTMASNMAKKCGGGPACQVSTCDRQHGGSFVAIWKKARMEGGGSGRRSGGSVGW